MAVLAGLAGSGTGAVAVAVGVAVGSAGAVGRLTRRAGPRAVAIGAGLAVAATAGLAVTEVGAWAAAGAALALAVVGAQLAILTLLPALVAVSGEPTSPAPEDGPGRWDRLVTGQPGWALLGALAAVGLVAVGVVALAATGSGRSAGTSDPAQDRLAAEFGPGSAGPLLITVEVDRPVELADTMAAVATRAERTAGVALAAAGRTAPDGAMGVVTVLPMTGPADPATREVLDRLRTESAAIGGARIQVTGATAVAIEAADGLAAAGWRYLLIVGPVLLVVLAVSIRPRGLAAAAGSVLSLGVTVGAAGLGVALAGGGGPVADLRWPAVGLAVLLALVLDQAARTAAGGTEHAGRTVGLTAVLVAVPAGGVLLSVGPTMVGTLVVAGVMVDALVVRATLLPALAAQFAPPARPRGRHRG